jgi:hypothetical protein
MHIWSDIFARELIMLAILLCLGSGPASFLGRRFDAAARVAMAPVLGLCLGTCVFTTLIWFTAARNTYWLLPILALASLAAALCRGSKAIPTDSAKRSTASRAASLVQSLGLRGALTLAVVCVVVAAPLDYTLHERHSVGPIGFEVWDAVGYTAETDGMVQQSIRQALHPEPANANFVRTYWTTSASGDQNLDAAPLSANVNELIGLHATDTQSLFLIVFLMTGALGAFAAVRYAAPKPFWVAPLAGILFAGPFFMQLISDGSQAATCGLGVILPIAAVGANALRRPRIPSLAVLALLVSGFMALYPIFVPGMVISAAVVLLVVAEDAWRNGKLTRETIARGAIYIGVLLALAIVFDLVSFTRDVRYWGGVLNGGYYLSSLPVYHLPYSVIPGWLLQTREFYSLSELGDASFHEVLIDVILPFAFIVVMIFGIKRLQASRVLLPFVAIFILMAAYTSASHHCSYCTDRALLPIAPVSIGLFVLGLAALATADTRRLRWLGVAIAVVAVIAVGSRTRQERTRFANGAYYLDAGDRALISDLPTNAGDVEIEGYGEGPGFAPGQLPLVYFLAFEHNHGAVSVPTEYSDYSALAYVGGAHHADPVFNPHYRFVLTRLGGVDTGRRVVARAGPLALEKRSAALDATITSGLGVGLERLDAQGLPWVEEPLHFIVAGGDSAPAWVSLRFRTIVPVAVSRDQPGVSSRHLPDGVLAACVRAKGTAPLRRAAIALTFAPLPGLVPNEPFAITEPPRGVQLTAMRAVTHCTLP